MIQADVPAASFLSAAAPKSPPLGTRPICHDVKCTEPQCLPEGIEVPAVALLNEKLGAGADVPDVAAACGASDFPPKRLDAGVEVDVEVVFVPNVPKKFGCFVAEVVVGAPPKAGEVPNNEPVGFDVEVVPNIFDEDALVVDPLPAAGAGPNRLGVVLAEELPKMPPPPASEVLPKGFVVVVDVPLLPLPLKTLPKPVVDCWLLLVLMVLVTGQL